MRDLGGWGDPSRQISWDPLLNVVGISSRSCRNLQDLHSVLTTTGSSPLWGGDNTENDYSYFDCSFKKVNSSVTFQPCNVPAQWKERLLLPAKKT